MISDVPLPPPSPYPMPLILWLISVYVGEGLAILSGTLILKYWGLESRRALFLSITYAGVSFLVGYVFWILWDLMGGLFT